MNFDSYTYPYSCKSKVLRVLITGMSGTGKSTVLEKLSEQGHRVVDTDSDEWSHWVTLPDGSTDWVWREDAISELLTSQQQGKLFVAGCKSNQENFMLCLTMWSC